MDPLSPSPAEPAPRGPEPGAGVSVASRFYTGVGSRSTPPEVLRQMERIAERLALRGWTLRSGGADGADSAFARGAARHAAASDIYVPWHGFNGVAGGIVAPAEAVARAEAIAATSHPVWNSLTRSVKALHTRNVFQVLGTRLDRPSDFLLCWTPDAAESEATSCRGTGGTRTAIVIAQRYGVPVINLARSDAMTRLTETVMGLSR